ncbi:hypothetical protein [Imhoffiella purpurea]|uniref:Uncharacterized protein n=1 Tax=Imhoffiella purpurea TaxID=1249627 RepID=W9V680_9GAMM|nr:hypothetical protein [Imhoffiella purpurea]EXJ14869.1 hypothetical protein D779_2075 [Imhoffiella purpurea]
MASKPTGRPRGRPRGSVSKRQKQIREAIESAAPDLVEKLLEAATAGDTAAATALLDRVIPKLRASSAAIVLDLSGSPTEIGQRLLDAVGKGEVPVDVAREVLDLAARARPAEIAFEPPDYKNLDQRYEELLANREIEKQRMIERAQNLQEEWEHEQQAKPSA